MKFTYPAKLVEQEGGGYTVLFRDLPEAITDGDSLEEALENAADCLEEAVAGRMDDAEDIPVPGTKLRAGEHWVTLPIETAMKAVLYMAVRQQKLSKSAFAKKLQVDEKVARRLLNPRYSSKLPAMQKALKVVGADVALEARVA